MITVTLSLKVTIKWDDLWQVYKKGKWGMLPEKKYK